MKVVDYDEANDVFIIEPEQGEQFPLDAGSLACILGRFDEPHAFIGVVFSVQVQS